MQYRTKIAATFKKEFKRLYKRYPSLEQDVKNLREEILANPTTIGTDLRGGLRKIRMRIASNSHTHYSYLPIQRTSILRQGA